MQDSNACTKASRPRAAVWDGGQESVRTGSAIATSATIEGCRSDFLIFVAGSVNTGLFVISAPVPELVGNAAKKSPFPGISFFR